MSSFATPTRAGVVTTTAPTDNSTTGDDEVQGAASDKHVLTQIDQEFQQLGCLGHGGFGSVFLAQKKSGRKVALKVVSFGEDEAMYDAFVRELDAVLTLNSEDKSEQESRDLSIVYFEDWIIGQTCAFIVMNYVDGGTLAEEIQRKTEPYTERRIAWYALQLSEALAFAHERGVAHHDVKGANVLIDKSRGGTLMLVDFGSAVAPNQESVLFTEIYASPELLAARERDEYSGIRADKVDSWGLGCVMFELLCCKKLVDLSDEQTIAEYVREHGAEATLDLPCVQFPWLPADHESTGLNPQTVGYSNDLKNLAKTVLEPNPEARWTLSQLAHPLRYDKRSPVIADKVLAAKQLVPGSPVTVDNIQLGMFVQRGQHWNAQDGDADGGRGGIGAVICLDADAGYTEVAWPCLGPDGKPSIEPMCHRIGEGEKYEIQVGPTPLADFCAGTDQKRLVGLINVNDDIKKYPTGHKINDNCIVVGSRPETNQLIVVPTEKIKVAAQLPSQQIASPSFVGQRKPINQPEYWDHTKGLLVEVTDVGEKRQIVDLFFATEGGMDLQMYEITSIQRVQHPAHWKEFAITRESIANENWGLVKEEKFFHGTGDCSPENFIQNPAQNFHFNLLYTKNARTAVNRVHRQSSGTKQLILSRVALGRVKARNVDTRDTNLVHHSEEHDNLDVLVKQWNQAYAEYIISYTQKILPTRRMVVARRPCRSAERPAAAPRIRRRPTVHASHQMRANAQSTHSNSTRQPSLQAPQVSTPTASVAASSLQQSTPPNTKMCVVCWERPSCFILLPCGHPCLCEVCSTKQGLKKLKKKCPECRGAITQAARFYGRIVED